MDIGVRSRLTTGFAVIGVGALVMTPVVAGQSAQAPTPAAPPAAMLTVVTQPLPTPRLLAQPAPLAPLQPANPLIQQVGFHIAFVAGFLTSGAVLFAREFAIPSALLDDLRNGTPAPVAVSRALQTFAQIELEAGREMVGFAVQYVSFQLNFFANLATMPVAAVGAFATSFTAGMTPAVSRMAELTTIPRSMKVEPSTNEHAVESARDVKVSTTTSAATEQPKKPKTAVTTDDSVSAAKVTAKGETTRTRSTDTDDAAVPARSRDRAPRADQASAGEQSHKADTAQKGGGKKDDGNR
jgi:hypothetical protein